MVEWERTSYSFQTVLSCSSHDISSGSNKDEEKPEHDIAYIRIDMVEVRQFAQWMSTEKVEVAKILIARII